MSDLNKVDVRIARGADRSYQVIVGPDAFAEAIDNSDRVVRGKAFVISDSNVAPLYGGKFERDLKAAGIDARLVIFPAGESSKNREEKARIEDLLFKAGAGRDSVIYAIGGGVTTDLAGFIAATFMRGIDFINLPTSLLAAVDASVGGKTGIDNQYGKNLIGAFWQPKAVYVDIGAFTSLPASELGNGLAEMVKHAVIADRGLFDQMEKSVDRLLAAETETLTEHVEKNIAIKAGVVAADERESDLRQVLNYGHTIGHAIEKLMSYNLPHGAAVSIGMAAEGEIARRLGRMKHEEVERQNELLRRLHLPTQLPASIGAEKVLAASASDKKARAGKVRYSLPSGLGEYEPADSGYSIAVDDDLVAEVLKKLTAEQ